MKGRDTALVETQETLMNLSEKSKKLMELTVDTLDKILTEVARLNEVYRKANVHAGVAAGQSNDAQSTKALQELSSTNAELNQQLKVVKAQLQLQGRGPEASAARKLSASLATAIRANEKAMRAQQRYIRETLATGRPNDALYSKLQQSAQKFADTILTLNERNNSFRQLAKKRERGPEQDETRQEESQAKKSRP